MHICKPCIQKQRAIFKKIDAQNVATQLVGHLFVKMENSYIFSRFKVTNLCPNSHS